MIIYNKKKLQDGGKWYNDTTKSTVGAITSTANQASQANRKTYNPNTYQGNMLAGNVEDVDPDMKNQGEGVAAATGAVDGAMSGYESSGSIGGTALGAVIGGVSGWIGADTQNSAEYEAAQKTHDAAVEQADINYARNAQNRYSNQYSQYKQTGGQLGVGNDNRTVAQPTTTQPTAQPAAQPQQATSPVVSSNTNMGMTNASTTPNVVNMFSKKPGGFMKNGGTFGRKVNILMSSVSKKA